MTIQHEDERTRAGKRIMKQQGVYGGARPAALGWLLEFAQEPVHTLSQTEWALRWEEVKRFAEDAGIGEGPPLTNQRSVWQQLPAVFAYQGYGIRVEPHEWLATLQEVVKTHLKLYLDGESPRYNGLKIDVQVRPHTPGVVIHAGDLEAGFYYQMFHLLGDLGARIGRCRNQDCRRLFVAGRSDREFCRGLCQAKQFKKDHPKPKDQAGTRYRERKAKLIQSKRHTASTTRKGAKR